MCQDTDPFSERKVLDELARRALSAGTPRAVAAEAVRVTGERFPSRTRAARRRVEAYFWGVVRRRALQGAAPAVSRSLVIASLVSELREAGHTDETILGEVTRLYGETAGTALAGRMVA
jgi:hypothetical protein